MTLRGLHCSSTCSGFPMRPWAVPGRGARQFGLVFFSVFCSTLTKGWTPNRLIWGFSSARLRETTSSIAADEPNAAWTSSSSSRTTGSPRPLEFTRLFTPSDSRWKLAARGIPKRGKEAIRLPMPLLVGVPGSGTSLSFSAGGERSKPSSRRVVVPGSSSPKKRPCDRVFEQADTGAELMLSDDSSVYRAGDSPDWTETPEKRLIGSSSSDKGTGVGAASALSSTTSSSAGTVTTISFGLAS
mmetsp:Transcript_11621/g.26520  ORF Transcript_11621/g.26520 Transcript_11621/m.26520 type:complete len:242 (+) Transcript_11621:1700-2425(+)